MEMSWDRERGLGSALPFCHQRHHQHHLSSSQLPTHSCVPARTALPSCRDPGGTVGQFPRMATQNTAAADEARQATCIFQTFESLGGGGKAQLGTTGTLRETLRGFGQNLGWVGTKISKIPMASNLRILSSLFQYLHQSRRIESTRCRACDPS